MQKDIYDIYVAKCKNLELVPLGCLKGSISINKDRPTTIEELHNCPDITHVTGNKLSLDLEMLCFNNPAVSNIINAGLEETSLFAAGTHTVTDTNIHSIPDAKLFLCNQNEDNTIVTNVTVDVVYLDETTGLDVVSATLVAGTDYTLFVDAVTGQSYIVLASGYTISAENIALGYERLEITYDYVTTTDQYITLQEESATVEPFFMKIVGKKYGYTVLMEGVSITSSGAYDLAVKDASVTWTATFTTGDSDYTIIQGKDAAEDCSSEGSSCGNA